MIDFLIRDTPTKRSRLLQAASLRSASSREATFLSRPDRRRCLRLSRADTRTPAQRPVAAPGSTGAGAGRARPRPRRRRSRGGRALRRTRRALPDGLLPAFDHLRERGRLHVGSPVAFQVSGHRARAATLRYSYWYPISLCWTTSKPLAGAHTRRVCPIVPRRISSPKKTASRAPAAREARAGEPPDVGESFYAFVIAEYDYLLRLHFANVHCSRQATYRPQDARTGTPTGVPTASVAPRLQRRFPNGRFSNGRFSNEGSRVQGSYFSPSTSAVRRLSVSHFLVCRQ